MPTAYCVRWNKLILFAAYRNNQLWYIFNASPIIRNTHITVCPDVFLYISKLVCNYCPVNRLILTRPKVLSVGCSQFIISASSVEV